MASMLLISGAGRAYIPGQPTSFPRGESMDVEDLGKGDPDLYLKKPISVLIETIGEIETIVSFPLAGVFMSGDNADEALSEFKSYLCDLFVSLKTQKAKSAEMVNSLKVMEAHIGKRGGVDKKGNPW